MDPPANPARLNPDSPANDPEAPARGRPPVPATISAKHSHEPPDRVTPAPRDPAIPHQLHRLKLEIAAELLSLNGKSDPVETPYLGVHETVPRPRFRQRTLNAPQRRCLRWSWTKPGFLQ